MRTTLASRGRGREAGQPGAAPGAHQHGEAAGVTAARPGQAGDEPAGGNGEQSGGCSRGRGGCDAGFAAERGDGMGASVHLREGPGRERRRWSGSIAELRVGSGGPQAGPVPVSCSLAPAPASRARTTPMAGSWLAGSGSGGAPGTGSGRGGRLSASPRSRLSQAGDDAVGAALGAARAGRESRSGTPGSRAMHSSNRARPVRTLQLATLKNGHDF
jgi:hypothetical protein